MSKALVAVLAAALVAGCQSVPPPIPGAGEGSLACTLVKASQCAYRAERDDVLPPDFCPGLVRDPQEVDSFVGTDLDMQGHFRDAVLVVRGADDVIIAFRGTLAPGPGRSLEQVYGDWKNDAQSALTSDPQLGSVHSGFRTTLEALLPAISRKLAEWKAAGELAGKHIYVTGHSKGGTLALLAAAALKRDYPIEAVYTYAAARPGGADFAALYKRERIATVRFENEGDVIPHLPPTETEVREFRLAGDPYFAELIGHGQYTSVGEVYYIEADGTIVKHSTPEFEASRLERFRRQIHEHVGRIFAWLYGNHTVENTHRYYQAACGPVKPVAP